MPQKNIRIRYFASLREALGKSEETCLTEAQTVGQLRAELTARGQDYQDVLQESRVLRSAVNQLMVGVDEPIADGDEVAFFPPVTGG